MTFDRYISGIQSAFQDLADPNVSQAIAVEVAKPLDKLIVDLNTNNQLSQSGTDGTGLPVTPRYAARTIQYKRRKGQPANRVTLRDSGDFHNSFKAIFKGGEIEIIATDPKTGDLLDKYGPDILGLDDTSLQTLRDKVKPLLIQHQKEQLAGVI